MIMFSKAVSKGRAWHQDYFPDNPLRYNLNWLVYTLDITDDTGGGIAVIPGAHIARLSSEG